MNMDYIFGKENISLLTKIISKKIFTTVGIDILEQNTEFFFDVLYNIANEVVKKETNIFHQKGKQQAILKINNIIIVETVDYILLNIDNSMTSLENLETPEEKSTGLELLKHPLDEPPDNILDNSLGNSLGNSLDTTKENTVVNKCNTINYCIEKDNCEYNSPEYSQKNLNLTDIKTINLQSIIIDNTSYNITEFNNCIVIDDKEVAIPPGNYVVDILCETMSKHIHTKFDKITGKFSFLSENSVKVDFTVKNSICKVLGFNRKVYKLQPDTELVADYYNNLSCTCFVKVDISLLYRKETKDIISVKVPMDVDIGSTKFYYPISCVSSKCSTIDEIVFSLRDNQGCEYLTRDRNFYINLSMDIL